MSTKKVEAVISAPPFHMVGDGFRVHNFIPGRYSMERMSPFIMLDYGSKHYFSPTDKPRGVDVHPHRGFETVTIAYKGKVAHHDSAGNSGIIGEGDVQWMTAASGVLHKEYHEENFSKQGGEFQMVQLWVNLPAKYKMSKPKYQEITNDTISKVHLKNNEGMIEVIAGEYQHVKGSAETFTPVNLLNSKLNKGGKASFSFPAHYNTFIIVLEGKLVLNEINNVDYNCMAVFSNNGTDFTIEALEDSIVLVLSGEPINEPIFAHGPFVMNTREEIVQAFNDFQNGKFGILN
jgi:redox-sensitive bicupin YhaK (pirin superfamily)